jgi:hypothetical protein
MTELANGAITAVDTVTIELGEADETPAIVIVTYLPRPLSFTRAVSVWRGSDKTGTHGALPRDIGSVSMDVPARPNFLKIRILHIGAFRWTNPNGGQNGGQTHS